MNANSEACPLPEWVLTAQRRHSGAFYKAKSANSTAKKILALYEPSRANEDFVVTDFFFSEKTEKNFEKMIDKSLETLTLINSQFGASAQSWEPYKTASFICDMFPLFSNASTYANNIEANSYSYVGGLETLTLGVYDKALIDEAFSNLTEPQKETLRASLNSKLYRSNMREQMEEKSGMFLCQLSSEIFNGDNCESVVCLTHRRDRSNVADFIVNTNFFREILLKTDYLTADLPQQIATLASESQSATLNLTYEDRRKILNSLVEALPNVGSQIMVEFIIQGKVRAYDLAETIYPHIVDNYELSKTLFSIENTKLREFHAFAGRKYLVEECGWDSNLPSAWFEKALSAEMLPSIYLKTLKDRREALGSRKIFV